MPITMREIKQATILFFLSYKISQIAHCQDRDIKNI